MSGWESTLGSFWSGLLVHLWQTSLVLLPLLLLRPLLSRLSARGAEVVWSLALLKLLVPAVWWAQLLETWNHQAAGLVSPERLVQGMTLLDKVEPAWTAPVALLREADVSGGGPALVLLLLTAVWWAGVLWNLKATRKQMSQAAQLGRVARADLTPTLQTALRRSLARSGVADNMVRVTDMVTMPQVVGFRRPRILLPAPLVAKLDTEELAAILMHEDGHRRRRDPLRTLVHQVIHALYWFYPLALPVLKQLQENAEFAADERALRGLGDPTRYARAVAGTVMMGLSPRGMASAMAGGGPSLLRRRLERLDLKERKTTMWKSRVAMLTALVLLLVGIILPVAVSGQAPPPPPPPPPKEPAPQKVSETAPPPPPPPVVEPRDLDEDPVLLEMVKPEYSELAVERLIKGTVFVQVKVDKEGLVTKAWVLEGPEELRNAALEAARGAKFRPGMKDGKPVPCKVVLPFSFTVE